MAARPSGDSANRSTIEFAEESHAATLNILFNWKGNNYRHEIKMTAITPIFTS